MTVIYIEQWKRAAFERSIRRVLAVMLRPSLERALRHLERMRAVEQEAKETGK